MMLAVGFGLAVVLCLCVVSLSGCYLCVCIGVVIWGFAGYSCALLLWFVRL